MNERSKWLKDIETAQIMTTKKMSGVYHCPELSLPAVRPGADNHMEYPSRRGNTLYYRDGRTERITQ